MDLARVSAHAGVGTCVAVLVALAAPFVLLDQPGTGLSVYYQSGPVGGIGIAFLALVGIVVFLSGERGSADRVTVAGVALTLSIGLVALALLWALAVDLDNVLSFTGAWMGWHRWLVVGLTGLVVASAGAYARAVV